MIRIINGKRYNTETATYIAEYDNGLPSNDFGRMKETLYRTPKGNYFLYGEGGAMSKYAERLAGGVSGYGKNIIPISREEAREWLENRNFVDAIEIEFAGEIEDA